MKNTIKKMILIFVMITIGILVTILLIIFLNKKAIINSETGSNRTSPEEIEINTSVDECRVVNEYFIVKDIINQYFSYAKQLKVNEEDLDVYRLPLSEEELEQYIKKGIEEKEKFAKETIYNILEKNILMNLTYKIKI